MLRCGFPTGIYHQNMMDLQWFLCRQGSVSTHGFTHLRFILRTHLHLNKLLRITCFWKIRRGEERALYFMVNHALVFICFPMAVLPILNMLDWWSCWRKFNCFFVLPLPYYYHLFNNTHIRIHSQQADILFTKWICRPAINWWHYCIDIVCVGKAGSDHHWTPMLSKAGRRPRSVSIFDPANGFVNEEKKVTLKIFFEVSVPYEKIVSDCNLTILHTCLHLV